MSLLPNKRRGSHSDSEVPQEKGTIVLGKNPETNTEIVVHNMGFQVAAS